MKEHEIGSHCGDNAQRWAEQFCERFPEMDEGLMHTWFANAIEVSSDVRNATEHESDSAQVNPSLEEFLFELTELSRKYHLAINGEPDLFVMEVEDYEIVYFCDDDSRLCIGIEE